MKDSPYKERYRPFGLLNALALKMAAGIAAVVIARAGSGTIYEVASWGIPHGEQVNPLIVVREVIRALEAQGRPTDQASIEAAIQS